MVEWVEKGSRWAGMPHPEHAANMPHPPRPGQRDNDTACNGHVGPLDFTNRTEEQTALQMPTKHVEKLVRLLGLEGCKPVATPGQPQEELVIQNLRKYNTFHKKV